MNMIDTHAHLFSKEFDIDIEDVVKRSKEVRVKSVLLPNIDVSTISKLKKTTNQFPDFFLPMMGLHPTHVKDNYKDELGHVEEMLKTRKFYGVGEIGIDLYWDKSTLRIQQEAFKHQIKLAKKHHLPIIIHCREAFDEIFEVLETEKSENLFGIFHCFTGNLEQAHKAISYNMKLGIGGVITFKNGKIDQFLNKIDLKDIVLETDSPYLAPVPYRGKRNESGYIINVLEKLSIIYNSPLEDIAAITTQNSKDIFKI